MKKGKVIIYKSRTGWRWKIIASNGRKLANGGEGYKRRIDCARALFIVLEDAWSWETP